MRNGQLKPGYNAQIAVNSEYITGPEVFSERGDAKTVHPMMRKLAEKYGKPHEETVSDAGDMKVWKTTCIWRRTDRFSPLKNDAEFRRFLTGGKRNIRTELFFLARAFDLKKLWMKQEHNRLKTRVSLKMVS